MVMFFQFFSVRTVSWQIVLYGPSIVPSIRSQLGEGEGGMLVLICKYSPTEAFLSR